MPLTDDDKQWIEWCPCGHVWEAHAAPEGCLCSECSCPPRDGELVCAKHKCRCINIDERLNVISTIIDIKLEEQREQLVKDIWSARHYYENKRIISRKHAAKIIRGEA